MIQFTVKGRGGVEKVPDALCLIRLTSVMGSQCTPPPLRMLEDIRDEHTLLQRFDCYQCKLIKECSLFASWPFPPTHTIKEVLLSCSCDKRLTFLPIHPALVTICHATVTLLPDSKTLFIIKLMRATCSGNTQLHCLFCLPL